MNVRDNSIIVCDQNTKNEILKQTFHQKKLFNTTFFSLEEFKNRFFFKITDQAVLYASKFLKMSYKNAKVIVKNIYYVDLNDEYTDNKLLQLQSLKKELIEKDLLEFDNLFAQFIKDKSIYVIDMFLDVFAKKASSPSYFFFPLPLLYVNTFHYLSL